MTAIEKLQQLEVDLSEGLPMAGREAWCTATCTATGCGTTT